jgi:uncharacterized damage-inducible protein DinB
MKQMIEAAIASAEFDLGMVLAAARHIPEDKLTWSPGGKATSALQILGHVSGFVEWLVQSIESGQMYQGSTDDSPANLAEAEALCKAAMERFATWARGLSDETLSKDVVFPWETAPAWRVLNYFDWNNTYHMGQLNYIQLLLGDEEMYMD